MKLVARLPVVVLCALLALPLGGCLEARKVTVTTSSASSSSTSGNSGASADDSSDQTTSANQKSSSTQGGKIELEPGNTRIEFVCAHVGEKPDPRKGSFAKLQGTAMVDPDAKTLTGLSIEFDTASVQTDFDKLTAHLASEDFFDVKKYPAAKFVSTAIVAEAGSRATITGNLTLLETTKEIEVPAEISVTDDGVKLLASFSIDRAEFGMDKLADKVEKKVDITVTIGK